MGTGKKNGCKQKTLKGMKHIVIKTAILFAMFTAHGAVAQKILLGFGGGIAKFNMSDTKEYNRWVQQDLPFTPSITDDFPDWYFFNAEALYSFPKFIAAGLNVSTTSTGSRLHLADYSGEYTFDNVQKGWFPGVKILLGKAPGKQSGPCVSLEGGLAFSSMSFTENIAVYEQQYNDEKEFSAVGYYIRPGVAYMQHIGKHIVVSANISYHLGFESGYYIRGKSDQKIKFIDTDENIKPGWNGLRAGMVVYWRL